MTITREIPGAQIRHYLGLIEYEPEGVPTNARRTLTRAGFVRYFPARNVWRLTEAGARVANGAPADPTADAVERYAEQLADHDAPESAPYARRLIEAELRAL